MINVEQVAVRARSLIFAWCLVLLAPVAYAVSCSVSVPSQDFGLLPEAGTSPGAIAVTVVCPSGLTFYVGSDAGLHSTGNFGWQVAGPSANFIKYQFFQNASRSVLNGGSPGSDEVSAIGTGSSQVVNLYPKTFAHTSIAGTYTDSVQIRVTVSGTQTTAQMAVTGTVTPTCTISAGNLNFGNYTNATVDATTTLTANCTNATTYQIGADLGQHSRFNNRFMAGPTSSGLQYHLYTSSSRTQELGTTSGTNEIPGTGIGAAQAIPVYGRVNGNHPEVAPGVYNDLVTVTITY